MKAASTTTTTTTTSVLELEVNSTTLSLDRAADCIQGLVHAGQVLYQLNNGLGHQNALFLIAMT